MGKVEHAMVTRAGHLDEAIAGDARARRSLHVSAAE